MVARRSRLRDKSMFGVLVLTSSLLTVSCIVALVQKRWRALLVRLGATVALWCLTCLLICSLAKAQRTGAWEAEKAPVTQPAR